MAKPLLNLQLTAKNLLVFLFFFFLMHELHELAHVITGRIICGCWGTRDFNVWDTCTNCLQQKSIAILATFTGPLFTFLMLWLGWYMVKYSEAIQSKSLGMALIFGNMPFGRMYMAATGSGDEVWGMRFLFLNSTHSNLLVIKIATFIIVSAICIVPLIAAYKAMANQRKAWIFTGFLVLPLVLDTIAILILLNGVLKTGLLSQVWIMGTPLLITVWFALCLLVVGVNFKSLTEFAKRNEIFPA